VIGLRSRVQEVPYGIALAASRTWAGRGVLKRFSVIMRQRIVPDESSKNSAGRAMSASFGPCPALRRNHAPLS